MDSSSTVLIPTVSARNWTVEGLMAQGITRFMPAPRVSAMEKSQEELSRIVMEYERAGVPLIVEDLHKRPDWSSDVFAAEWLMEHGEPSAYHSVWRP